MMGEVVTLKFAAPCASCRKLLRVGESAFLDWTPSRRTWCPDHVPAPDDPVWRKLASATSNGRPWSLAGADRISRATSHLIVH
jgi:hypothetical protein